MPTPIQQLQAMLHNRQLNVATTLEIKKFAKDNNLIIIINYNKENVDFCGADFGYTKSSGQGDIIHFSKSGLCYSESEITNGQCTMLLKDMELLRLEQEDYKWKKITVKGNDPYWSYQVDFPHLTFDILEGDNKYCEGIIFDLDVVFSE